MSAPLFAARGLDKRFGAVVAADNVTVEIAAGETVGIIGATCRACLR
jgi:branched-chain amino acid transport system ATP-binding protein